MGFAYESSSLDLDHIQAHLSLFSLIFSDLIFFYRVLVISLGLLLIFKFLYSLGSQPFLFFFSYYLHRLSECHECLCVLNIPTQFDVYHKLNVVCGKCFYILCKRAGIGLNCRKKL